MKLQYRLPLVEGSLLAIGKREHSVVIIMLY